LSEAPKKLKEKLELSDTLLEKLEALKKATEDASGLRDITLERHSVIDSLRSPVKEKLELRGKVQQLELSLQCRECEVADL